jgi:putative hydrolase of the HAD superfamily
MYKIKELDAIIFDLGGVILNLDFSRTIKAFQLAIPNLDLESFLGKEGQHKMYSEFEVGKKSTFEFVQEFNQYYQVDLSLAEFANCWNAMILDMPVHRIELLKKLRNMGKQVYLLSNINAIHEDAVSLRFLEAGEQGHFRDMFNHKYYSHHIKMRKPNPEIFQHVIHEQKLHPERTLFVDDTKMHVDSARKLGLQTHHLQYGQDITELFI